jgi:hypothetical protein
MAYIAFKHQTLHVYVYTKHIIVPKMLPSGTVIRYLEEENYVTLLHIKRDIVPTSYN